MIDIDQETTVREIKPKSRRIMVSPSAIVEFLSCLK